jgi:hypothetical protein
MKKLFSYFLFLSILFIFSVINASAKEIAAPIILEIGEKIYNEDSSQFYVKGLTERDSDILIYINGVFADYAKINIEGTETDNFYFESDLALDSFEVMAISRDKKTHSLSPSSSQKYILSQLPAPTVVFPENKGVITDKKITVLGLSKTNSIVEVYIDSKYSGETKFLIHESGTANFAYYQEDILEKGSHSLYLIARDVLGGKSKISDITYFEVEHSMPAPTLFEPVINSNTSIDKPYIVGVAKNNSFIKVFVDDKLDGEFLVKNNESGTANFAYLPKIELSRGSHNFSAIAIDNKNKKSKLSNNEEYTIRQPLLSEAVQEKNEELLSEVVAVKKENEEKIEKDPLVLFEDNINEIDEDVVLEDDNNESSFDGTMEDVGEVDPEAVTENGALDENKQKQNKLNIDLMIFLAFLLGIIVWIIWVNKELIKEKKETKDDPEN